MDACPVVAYGALLPQRALDVPAHGWVNLHFSLLPAWRGAAPVQHAILHGDDVTGASTFLIEAGLDTGPVFGVVTEPIRPTDTSGDLLERLAVSGAGLLVATMDGIADGSLVPRPQPADGVSIAGKIGVADARVPWDAPARHVDRLVRACTPAPGAWTTFRGERLKLGPVRLRGANELAPGAAAGRALRRRGRHGHRRGRTRHGPAPRQEADAGARLGARGAARGRRDPWLIPPAHPGWSPTGWCERSRPTARTRTWRCRP